MMNPPPQQTAKYSVAANSWYGLSSGHEVMSVCCLYSDFVLVKYNVEEQSTLKNGTNYCTCLCLATCLLFFSNAFGQLHSIIVFLVTKSLKDKGRMHKLRLSLL